MRFPVFQIAVSLFLVFSCAAPAQEADTLTIIDITANPSAGIPDDWRHVLPSKQRAYTNFSVEERQGESWLRAMSSGTSSWLEKNVHELDTSLYPLMEWRWMVNQFPETGWEMNRKNDDFAIRIELVYDLRGSRWNILNMIRKGLITAFFKGYPPELVVSYVWSHNVPADKPYASPSTKGTMIIPVESDVAMQGLWVAESRNIHDDLVSFMGDKTKLVLKSVRIVADTESVPTVSESGLKYIRFIRAEQSNDR